MPAPDETPRPDVERLFLAAADAPPEARAALLEGAPSEVRAEVEALLAAEVEASAYFERPAGFAALLAEADDLLPEAPPEDPALAPGTRLGAYVVREEVGRGGMGTVYRAERADGLFAQTVALKVVKRGMDTDEVLRRFAAERRALARLSHPGVARLLDAGVTADGRPFLAMEFVDGEPLLAWADAHRLDVRARLRLFLQVGEAVAAAHRALLVHRDLKPGNVYVSRDADGAPHVTLLDFGIAKALDEGEDGALTQTGRRPYTPAYAAPEQRDGRPVTTATDVWALGALLHELLTGHRAAGDAATVSSRPSAAATRPAHARSRLGEAPSLSPDALAACRATTPARLARTLAGDLDAIVLKALREEPEARYPTVDALADDLRRYLDGRPVHARRGTARYVARKFVRRHRTAVAVAAMGVLLLGVFVGALVRERDRVAAEAARAEAVAAFLADLFRSNDPGSTRGATRTAREVLDAGARRLAALDLDAATRARLQTTVGGVYVLLGLPDQALPLLTDALATQRRLHGARSPAAAATLNELGHAHYLLGGLDEAEAAFREALAIHERARAAASDTARAAVEHGLGMVLTSTGDFDEARTLLLRARERYGRAGVPAAEARELAELGALELRLGRHAQADSFHSAAYALRRAHLPRDHPDFYNSLHALGTLRYHQGRHDEAERLLREAIALQERVRPDDYLRLVTARNDLALVQRARGDHAGAERSFREILALYRRHAPDNAEHIATVLHNLGWTLKGAGDLDAAERHFREALALNRRALGERHFNTSFQLMELGRIAALRGRPAEALPLFREALAIRRAELEADDLLVLEVQGDLGAALLAAGRHAEAEPLLRRYLAGTAENPTHARRAADVLARLLTATGRDAEARRVLAAAPPEAPAP